MAKVKIKLKRPAGKGWTTVVLIGLLLAVLAIIDSGELGSAPVVAAADNSTGCQFRVTVTTPDADGGRELNVRAAATTGSAVRGTIADGTVVDTTAVVTNGFRQLEGGLWAAVEHLTPVSGDNCN